MKKYIFIIISLSICFVHFGVYAGGNLDYKTYINNVLDEPRIFFEPELVENIFIKNPEIFDEKSGVRAYDSLVEKNDGYMSIDDLFYVCVMSIKKYNKASAKMANWQKDAWPECKEYFILPLLDLAEEEMVIDDSVSEVYDGTRFDQPCTRPTLETNIANMICTTGKYRNTDPAFEKAMITKFRLEGGCKDVHDGNGITCFGVASRWNKEVMEKYPNFTRADAEEIAHDRYYTKYKIDTLPDAIRGDVFMALWGTGQSSKSIGLLQDILGVKRTDDGRVDMATVIAARNYKGNLRKRFLKARWELQKDNKSFSNGWAKGFLIYLKNGCHSKTETPLLRTKETTDECKKYL